MATLPDHDAASGALSRCQITGSNDLELIVDLGSQPLCDSLLTAEQLESGYWRAYQDFYRWSAIWRGASTKERTGDRLRHLAYAGGWKKFEPLWDLAIRSRQVLRGLPLLESVLAAFGGRPASSLASSGRPAAAAALPVGSSAPR